MNQTGIVRKIDQLGRIVIPKELRNTLEINDFDPIEILMDNDNIVLRKYRPSCIFCGNNDYVTSYKGKLICHYCIGIIGKL